MNPVTAGSLADELSLRLRDPINTAHNRLLVLQVIAEAQRLVNAENRAVLSSADLTVDSDTHILIVPLLLPFAMRVETIRDGVRDVTRCDWREIAEADRLWLKRRGGHVVAWAHFSPSRVLLYPSAETTLTVVYTKRTNPITTNATLMELDQALHPAILNLAEHILLTRQKLFPSMKPASERLERDLTATAT